MIAMLCGAGLGAANQPQSPVPAESSLVSELLAATSADARTTLLAARGGPTPELVAALQAEGDSRFNAGKYAAAADAFRVGVELSEKVGDLRVTGPLWQAVGYSLRQAERLDEAEHAYTRALDLFTQAGDESRVASVTKSFGILRRRQGRYDEARSHYLTALPTFRRLGDDGEVASTLSSLAVLEGTVADFTAALPYHLEAVEIMRRTNDDDLALGLSNLGALYKELGDGANAELQYREALQLARAARDRPMEGLVLSNLGSIQINHGDPAEAFRTLQDSLAIFEALNLRGRTATVLNVMGTLRLAQGNLEQAEGYFRRSLVLRERLKDPSATAYSLNNMASVYREQGRLDDALEFANRALVLREDLGEKSTTAATLRRIGIILTDQGRLDEAAAALDRARGIAETISDRIELARTLSALARVAQQQGRDRDVIELSQRAAVWSREVTMPTLLWPALTMQAGATARLGDRARAMSLLREAIGAIEELRWQAPGAEQDLQLFFQGKVAPYYQLVSLLFEDRDWHGALAVAERAKARVLSDVLASGRVSVTTAMTEAEKHEEERLRLRVVSSTAQAVLESRRPTPNSARVSTLAADQRAARLAFETFQTNLYSTHAALKTRRAEDAALDFVQAAAALPSGTAVIEFVVADDRTLAFVIKQGASRNHVEVSAYPVPLGRVALSARVEKFRAGVGERSLAFARDARTLHADLLAPAAARLRGIKTLIVIPDGPLWTLPFQALQPSPGRYLVQDLAVAYAPSLAVLLATHEAPAPRTSSSALVVAGPDGAGADTTPGTPRLVSSMRAIYGARSDALLGRDADERSVKQALPKYAVVHFTGHGVLNGLNPLDSHLRLSASASAIEDGLLEARELMRMNLQADLLVLAGCETALGRVGQGEGMVGLSWAAFVAGSATTVVSQWKVDAESTTDLMVDFHRRRAGTRNRYLSTAQAMQRAALSLLQKPATEHPFYWAGFAVVGRP